MPCDSHATPMRSSLCVLCVLCELRKTSVRIPCDLCTCSATPMRVPCDQSECQTTPARLLLDLAESYKGGTSAWIFKTACDVVHLNVESLNIRKRMVSGPTRPIFIWVFFVGSNGGQKVVLWYSHRALICRTGVA